MYPELYHAHHNLYTEDLPFWLDLARSQADTVLEFGCGTGRVILPLVEAGHELIGLDNQPEMIAFLQKLLQERQVSRVQVIEADMTNFDLGVEFSLIILPCNTYSTLSVDQRLNALACVRRHLAPGGVFAASMFNPARLAELSQESDPEMEEVFTHPKSGNPVQVSSSWVRRENSVEVIWHYDHLLPNGEVERETMCVHHTLASQQDYINELQAGGFKVQETFGDFERAPYSPEMPYFIFTAKVGK
ncbi:MAG: class I SAM-dependent methyltransferase [Chloroflexi bacterium]|nr:class I SAM-dependent methyltransferase [Chloroflexota bacterium]